MIKEIGFGALAIVVVALSLVFVPALDAVMRRQGVREVEQLCSRVARKTAEDPGYDRPEVVEEMQARGRRIMTRRRDGWDEEEYTYQIGLLPFGRSHHARIRILYDGEGRVAEIEPTFPPDLRQE